jgi:hypothetical protein
LNLGGVKKLLAPLRAKALALGFDQVGEFFEVGPDYTWAFHHPRGPHKLSDLLPPSEGVIFSALPGDGSESVDLGLCRYEGVPGWRFRSYCKTQYASRHGWEHFLKCHRGVVELLWLAEELGLRVSVKDEGELWKTGSHARLRRNLEACDQSIAALAGALQDRTRKPRAIQAPIFDHPCFERLEAEGLAAHGGRIGQVVELVGRLPG